MAQSRRVGLKWKIAGLHTGIMLAMAAALIAMTYGLSAKMLHGQLDKRALAIATNLSDAAAPHVTGRNLLALHAVLRKYSFLDGVAYALITNEKGELVAHTFGTFPAEIRQEVSAPAERQVRRREFLLGGKTIYDTAVPVLEGQAGTVHIGFWADAADKEIRAVLLPVVGLIALLPVIGALLSFVVAHRILRPLAGLTALADKVTKGDLETTVSDNYTDSPDEIGDLARSLERMRASLRAAMLRLNREVA